MKNWKESKEYAKQQMNVPAEVEINDHPENMDVSLLSTKSSESMNENF